MTFYTWIALYIKKSNIFFVVNMFSKMAYFIPC